jgi:predicted RNase H-like HicB family nuclease
MQQKKLLYSFRVEPSPGGGWTIWFPDLPGASGWVEKLEDVGVEAKTVAELWIDSERRRKHPLPEPTDFSMQEKWPQGNNVVIDGSGPVIGVPDMAQLLGVSERRVQALAKERGVGQRFGNYLLFRQDDIERLRPGLPGRPRKLAAAAD